MVRVADIRCKKRLGGGVQALRLQGGAGAIVDRSLRPDIPTVPLASYFSHAVVLLCATLDNLAACSETDCENRWRSTDSWKNRLPARFG